jgi:hypothetical protein
MSYAMSVVDPFNILKLVDAGLVCMEYIIWLAILFTVPAVPPSAPLNHMQTENPA